MFKFLFYNSLKKKINKNTLSRSFNFETTRSGNLSKREGLKTTTQKWQRDRKTINTSNNDRDHTNIDKIREIRNTNGSQFI